MIDSLLFVIPLTDSLLLTIPLINSLLFAIPLINSLLFAIPLMDSLLFRYRFDFISYTFFSLVRVFFDAESKSEIRFFGRPIVLELQNFNVYIDIILLNIFSVVNKYYSYLLHVI